jgi:Tfp pilus assembly protein PilN
MYGYLWFSGAQKNANLQLLQEQSQKLQAQADAFGIFEQKEQDLVARQAKATTALAGRINMGRVSEEVSLVLPDEVWLQTMGIAPVEGHDELSVTGYTPYSSSHSMDVSYKSVAKTLVRLNELNDVSDVWLTSAVNAEYTGFAPVTGVTALPAPVVTFTVKGQVSPSDASGEK